MHPTVDTELDPFDSRAPSLRPAPVRLAPVPRPTDRDAIARLLLDLPWHPYVWAYRAAFAVTAGLVASALVVLSAPSLSAKAALALKALDAANGFPLPFALLLLATASGFVGSTLLRGAVRLGRTYPPLPRELARRPAPQPVKAPTPEPPPVRTPTPAANRWDYEIRG